MAGVPAANDIGFGFDASVFSTPELDHEYFLGNTSDAYPQLDAEQFLPRLPESSSSADLAAWSGLEFPPVDDFLAPCPSSSSTSSVHEPSNGSSTNWWENDVFCENKQMLYARLSLRSHKESTLTRVDQP